ncbi:MAG: hypothetical protein ABIS86_17700, partial [Streptosporangiaceae bacterium]
ACAALFGSPLGQVAVETVGGSLTASRLTADLLAGALEIPGSAEQAALALGGAGDERSVPGLCAMLDHAMPPDRIGEVLADLGRTGREHPELVASARGLLSRAEETEPGLVRSLIFGVGRLGPAASAAVPELTRLLDSGEFAAPAVCALGRIGPAAVAAVPLVERFPGGPAAHALVLITGDRRYPDGYLAGRPVGSGRISADTPALLTWLAVNAELTSRQADQLDFLAGRPGHQAAVGVARWHHAGPAAADDLLRTIPRYLADAIWGPPAVATLTAMGPSAAPALADLDRLIDSRTRLGLYEEGLDRETREDERRLAALRSARLSVGPGR